MAATLQPVFPPELEGIIFGLAAQDDLMSIAKLSLVAKRVRQWVIPHLYEIVIFNLYPANHAPQSMLSVGSLLEHGKYVRHLLVQSTVTIIEERYDLCLSRCPNLRSLALWTSNASPYTPELISLLSSTQLQYLSFDIHAFSQALTTEGRSRTSVIFPTVTHLELIGVVDNVKQLQDCFPALTHLAISSFGSTPVSVLRDVLDLFGDQVKVLVWYIPNVGLDAPPPNPSVSPTSDYIDLEDPRVVALHYGTSFVGSWYEGVRGGLGIWKVADETVRARLASKKGD